MSSGVAKGRADETGISTFTNIEGALRSGETVSFSFGSNWRKYLAGLNDDNYRSALSYMSSAFGAAGISGRNLVDIGCGSGLFSMAALELGATSVTSIDVDPTAVACAELLRSRSKRPDCWDIMRGSILDDEFTTQIPRADRVFSWGVLHHTGDLWAALDQATDMVSPNGLLLLALYNRTRRPRLILAVKRTYNRTPSLLKPLMRLAYGGAILAKYLVSGGNPIHYVAHYGKERGMNFWRDVEDWLGGLPYQEVEPEELCPFVEKRGFRLVSTKVRAPGGNNEYLFERRA